MSTKPTEMPNWLQKQFDNAERTVAGWSEGKRRAAGIEPDIDPADISQRVKDLREKFDDEHGDYWRIQQIEHFKHLNGDSLLMEILCVVFGDGGHFRGVFTLEEAVYVAIQEIVTLRSKDESK